MISIALARQLRDAGLVWKPAPLDLFALPDRQMDSDIFVISDQAAFLQLYNGYPVVAFHGSSEWALDYVLLTEVVWMPSEGQIRQQIERRIAADAPLAITRTAQGYTCQAGPSQTQAPAAEEALALALLTLLRADHRPIDDR
ncbi:pilus assembly protein CpaE [Chloroflexia bacterium SDU3-3]|nr:pilus assembly protein CpaE [Chloroflexia bacterium SDU3-3]